MSGYYCGQVKRDGRVHILVVLRPPAKVSLLDVVVEQPSHRDGGPNVRQVVRSPKKTTVQEDGSMEVPENLPLPAEEVERDREDRTNKETPQEVVVDGTGAEHLFGPKGAPEHGTGEESVDIWAREVVLLPGRANIGDLCHLVVEDNRADEGGDESSEHLAIERAPGRDMDVMSEFEVLGEVEGMRCSDVSVGLEVVHCGGISGEPEPTEQIGNNVEGDFYVGDSHDDAAGNAEDGGEEDTLQRCGRGGIGGINGDTNSAEANGNTQDHEVDPLRNLAVRPHQAGVDILGVSEGRFTADQVLEAGSNLAAVIQSGVGNGRSISREIDAIEEGVAGGQTGATTSVKPDQVQKGRHTR